MANPRGQIDAPPRERYRSSSLNRRTAQPGEIPGPVFRRDGDHGDVVQEREVPAPRRDYDEHGTEAIGLNQVYDRITEATNRLMDIRVDQFDGEKPDIDILSWLER